MIAKIKDPQVGMRLKKTRELREMSQRELAKKTAVSYAYISRLEAGERYPSIAVLRRLASVLEVSPHYLETGDKHGFWVYVTRDELASAAGDGCQLCRQHLDEHNFVAA